VHGSANRPISIIPPLLYQAIIRNVQQCFLSRFWVSKWFWNDTLNFENQEVVLPCIEVKRFEESMFSCTWLLQQTAAMLQAETIFWFRSWKRKLQVWYLCTVMHIVSLRPAAILPQICTVWCTKLRKQFNAIMDEVFYCFITAIGFPGDTSDNTLQWRKKICSCSAHAKQGGCRVRQKWELEVRFWLFGPHWSSCQKIKMVQCALFYWDSR